MQTDWDNLITEIEKGYCAIFLGHGLICDASGSSVYPMLCDQLAQEHSNLIHAYYPEENFFLFKAKQHQRKFTNQISDYYTRLLKPDPELFQMLAEIPVSLYITVSPDNFLEKAIGEEVQMAFFDDPKNRGMEIEATKDRPLVYHLFGSVQDSNSILLSHDSLFRFFKTILGEQGLPTTIKKFFKEDGAGGEVIFLGFSFKKWYVQMLLRLFNLSADNQLSRTAYINGKPHQDEENFAVQHFQIQFVETNIKTFVTTLHQKCKERGILRQLNATKNAASAILVEEKQLRIGQIQALLQDKRKLRSDYEDRQTLSDDPKEIMRFDMEIRKLGTEIDSLRTELKSYAS